MRLVVTYCVVALGVIHTALTPAFYKTLSQNAMWYAGAGLALVLLGFVNIIALRPNGHDTTVRLILMTANVAGVMFMAVLTFVYPKPQVILGLVLLGIQAVYGFAG